MIIGPHTVNPLFAAAGLPVFGWPSVASGSFEPAHDLRATSEQQFDAVRLKQPHPSGLGLRWVWQGKAADQLADLLDIHQLFLGTIVLEEHFDAIYGLLAGMQRFLGDAVPDNRAALLRFLESRLCTEPQGQLVICHDSEVAGYIGFNLQAEQDEQGNPVGHLENCHLTAAYQRQGMGSAILNFLEEHYQAHNLRVSQMRVLSLNEAAVNFYQRRGYRIAEIIEMPDSASQLLLMRKSI